MVTAAGYPITESTTPSSLNMLLLSCSHLHTMPRVAANWSIAMPGILAPIIRRYTLWLRCSSVRLLLLIKAFIITTLVAEGQALHW